ncbi:outer membrane protein assembly factor [Alginatibacterium sediminis]|uniref:Outer membrane protein assembly factor n=2 Tax=Alginatibacterium sediminis TaxID=2164068 RepID=A0A420EBT2_9ALTE|nr:outer membrane protein assembly factor [Alginatibacterium sediminis]
MGYYKSTIKFEEDDKQRLVVNVDLGEPLLIGESNVIVKGAGAQAPEVLSILQNNQLEPNQLFSHQAYDKLKSELSRLSVRYGYFDAGFEVSEVKVSLARNTADINLVYLTGERYTFGNIEVQTEDVNPAMILDLAEFKTGDAFDSVKLGEFSQQISETDYFKSISVRPLMESREQQKVDIEVGLVRKEKNSYELGAGVSTDVGVRASAKWTRPIVNSNGHSITSELELSLPKQQVYASYRIPHENPIDDFTDLQIGYVREDKNDTKSTKYVASGTRNWRWDGDWYPSLFLRFQREDYIQGSTSDSKDLIIPGGNISRLRSRGGLDPNWGDNIQASAEFSNSLWASDVDFVRLTTVNKILRSTNKHRFVGRLELGGIFGDPIEDIPASMRFFAGGDQSIRGYGHKTISPLDESGQLLGASYLATSTIEYNYQFLDKWRAAIFVDAGTATNDFTDPISIGTGVGVRWITPVGPLRLDFAYGHQNPDSPWQIHFSIGPDL